MTTRSGILAWKIPWTEEPGGLQQSIGLQRVGQDWAHTHTSNIEEEKWYNLVVSRHLLALTLCLWIMFGCPFSSIPEMYMEVSSSWFISQHLTRFSLLHVCFIEMVLFPSSSGISDTQSWWTKLHKCGCRNRYLLISFEAALVLQVHCAILDNLVW